MIVWKVGDRIPAARFVLKSDGVAIDLTGCTITLRLQRRTTGVLTTLAMTIVSPASAGTVEYDRSADPSGEGDFLVWIRVVTAGGLQRTFPSRGADILTIEAAP